MQSAAFLLLTRGNDKVLQHPLMVGREHTVCSLLRQGLPEAQGGLEQMVIPCQPPRAGTSGVCQHAWQEFVLIMK